jgi:hypothetical protein
VGVLSERDRRVLADIERRICAEDPDLARRLVDGVPRRERVRGWPGMFVVLAVLAVLAVGLLLVLLVAVGVPTPCGDAACPVSPAAVLLPAPG